MEALAQGAWVAGAYYILLGFGCAFILFIYLLLHIERLHAMAYLVDMPENFRMTEAQMILSLCWAMFIAWPLILAQLMSDNDGPWRG